MDPNVCLALFRAAVRNQDWDAAVDHWCDLHGWIIGRGGFEPTWTPLQRKNFFKWKCPE